MKPISPATGAREIVVAENQPEYLPLPVAVYVDSDTPATHLLSRWTLTSEERAAVALGEDVYIAQLNFGTPMAPMVVQVGAGVYAAPETLNNPFHEEEEMKEVKTDEATDEPTIEHLRNALQMLALGDIAGARRRIELGIAALPVTLGSELGKNGVTMIAAARSLQLVKYDTRHDVQEHADGALAKVAAVLAVQDTTAEVDDEMMYQGLEDPWGLLTKYANNPIGRLAEAGAFLAAEIDRRFYAQGLQPTGIPTTLDWSDPLPDDPGATVTCLLLVLDEPQAQVLRREDVAAWTPEQRRAAEQWAGAMHCWASDNDVPEAERAEPDHVRTLRAALANRAAAGNSDSRTLASDLTEDR